MTIRFNIILLVMLAALWLGCHQRQAAAPISVSSPDGRARIELSLQAAGQTGGAPHYQDFYDGKEVISPSRLGVELEGGLTLGGPCQNISVERRVVRDKFTQVTGKRRGVRVEAAEVVVTLQETAVPRLKWEFIMRAANDGVAFRYRFPKQDGWEALVLAQERRQFHIPDDARTFALPQRGFVRQQAKLDSFV